MVLRSLSSDSPKVNQACRKGIGLLTKIFAKKRKANNVQRFHFIIPTIKLEKLKSLFSLSLSSGISIKMNTSGFITITIRYLSGALDIELNRKIDSLFVQDIFFEHYVFLYSVSIVPKFTWFRLFSFVFSASSSSSTSFALSEFVQRTLRFSEPFYIFYLNRIYFTLRYFALLEPSVLLYITLHSSMLPYWTRP